MNTALNRLAKWRTVFASWQLGTRSSEDAECNAVKDHREATLILRAEMTALVTLLVRKKILTVADFDKEITSEAGNLMKSLENRFPGYTAHDDGIHIDTAKAVKTSKGWPP